MLECWVGGKAQSPSHPDRKFCSISSRAGWRHPAWGGGRVIDNPSRPQTQAGAETTHTSLWGRGLDGNPGQYTQAIQVFAFKNWKCLPLPTSPFLYALKASVFIHDFPSISPSIDLPVSPPSQPAIIHSLNSIF